MDSDFFTEGYADKKALDEIEKRIEELRSELAGGFDHATGRSKHDVEKEIEALTQQKDGLLLKLEQHEA